MNAFAAHIAKWRLVTDGPEIETPSSWLLPVRQAAVPAMLKVYKPGSDERHGTDYLRYVEGDGAVRVMAADEEALLMERATGSRSLFDMAVTGGDASACDILAGTVAKLHRPRAAAPPQTLVPLERHFASLFERASQHQLLGRSAATARALFSTPRDVIALHGDLHHYNILTAERAPWLAIDPKGVTGDPGYDVGQFFLNPDLGDILAKPEVVRRRLDVFAEELHYDRARLAAWAFAEVVLSACWSAEDHGDGWQGAIAVAETLLSAPFLIGGINSRKRNGRRASMVSLSTGKSKAGPGDPKLSGNEERRIRL